jgi:hypothetical protein
MPSKINVSNPHPVGVASSHSDEGWWPMVVEIHYIQKLKVLTLFMKMYLFDFLRNRHSLGMVGYAAVDLNAISGKIFCKGKVNLGSSIIIVLFPSCRNLEMRGYIISLLDHGMMTFQID